MEEKNKFHFVRISIIIIIGIIAGAILFFHAFPGKIKIVEHFPKAPRLVRAIQMSILNYESTYGVLPWDTKKDFKFCTENKNDYDILLEILTCTPGPGNSNMAKGNTRNIKFLDIINEYQKEGYIDPWGKRFSIYLDLDYDNTVKIGNGNRKGTVFVYSSGPNGKDEEGGGDDICSWKD